MQEACCSGSGSSLSIGSAGFLLASIVDRELQIARVSSGAQFTQTLPGGLCAGQSGGPYWAEGVEDQASCGYPRALGTSVAVGLRCCEVGGNGVLCL